MRDDPRHAVTERLLHDAGLSPGMSVLDVGCGPGDVTFLAARMVGQEGRVTGIDRNAAALARARERATEPGSAPVAFVEGDLNAPPPAEGGYDAVTVRRVLMYQPDQPRAMAALANVLKPGGLIVFQEHAPMPSAGPCPLPVHEQVNGWLWSTVVAEGADPNTAYRLHALLAGTGLEVEQVRAEALVQTPRQRFATAEIVRLMIPRMAAQGVTNADQVDIDTLDHRLGAELERAQASYAGELMFGAWARKPRP